MVYCTCIQEKDDRMTWYGDPFDVWVLFVLREPCNSGAAVGVYRRRGNQWAHIRAYTETYGPIPEGWVIDHICGNKACSTPSHLEAVTLAENARRGNRGVTHQHVQAALVRRGQEQLAAFGVGGSWSSN
jgi:hypothetical protein